MLILSDFRDLQLNLEFARLDMKQIPMLHSLISQP